MEITNNNLTNILKKIQPTNVGAFSCSFSKLQSQPSKDCFVRSTNLITQITNKQRIQRLYDEAYSDALDFMTKANPVISKLNLTKPDFQVEKFKDPKKGGGYGFADNCIKIAEDIFDNCEYMVGTVDSSGELDGFMGLSSKENKDKKLAEAKKTDPRATLIKLTDEEQEIYVKSAIAHELRHFVQNHLIASTQNCGDKQKDGIDSFLKEVKDNLAKVKEEYIQACKELGQEPKQEFVRDDKQYYETYKPKHMLPEDTTLKFSYFTDDNRHFSVKDHLLKSQLDTTAGKGIIDYDDDYHSSALEIDAYNFQYEYLVINAFNKKNVRTNIIAALSLIPTMSRDEGLDIMNKRGITFIQK